MSGIFHYFKITIFSSSSRHFPALGFELVTLSYTVFFPYNSLRYLDLAHTLFDHYEFDLCPAIISFQILIADSIKRILIKQMYGVKKTIFSLFFLRKTQFCEHCETIGAILCSQKKMIWCTKHKERERDFNEYESWGDSVRASNVNYLEQRSLICEMRCCWQKKCQQFDPSCHPAIFLVFTMNLSSFRFVIIIQWSTWDRHAGENNEKIKMKKKEKLCFVKETSVHAHTPSSRITSTNKWLRT